MALPEIDSWRRTIGGLLFVALAHALLAWGWTVGEAGRVAVSLGAYPALFFVGLVSLALGLGWPSAVSAHRERASRAVFALALLGLALASVVGFAAAPGPRRAFAVLRWTLPALALVAAWLYFE